MYKVGAPYQIGGVWYYPTIEYHYEETGVASWYGEEFEQQYTANGEIFDLNRMTAAHRTLPMPSIVQITNIDNGRSVQLRVNDRGPFARGRIIDVSRRAAQLLGFETNGTALVRLTIMKDESIQVAELAKRHGGDSRVLVAEGAERDVGRGGRSYQTGSDCRSPAASAPCGLDKCRASPVVIAALPPLPEKAKVVPVKSSRRIFIQAGAFSVRRKAQRPPVAHCAVGERPGDDHLDQWDRNVPSAARAAARRRASRSGARPRRRQRLSRSTDRR